MKNQKTELKTLKDLNGLVQFRDRELGDWISKKELKAEAVKWVKMFQSRRDCVDGEIANGAERAFVNFFNLTEDDLK